MSETGKPPLVVSLPKSVISNIDVWRHGQPEVPARSEAVRRILQRALLPDEFEVSPDGSTVKLRRSSSDLGPAKPLAALANLATRLP